MIIHVQLRRCHVCDRPQATRRMIGRATIPQLQGASEIPRPMDPIPRTAPHGRSICHPFLYRILHRKGEEEQIKRIGSEARASFALWTLQALHYTDGASAPRTQLALHATSMAPHLVDLLDGVVVLRIC
jgi:hypothetical protein